MKTDKIKESLKKLAKESSSDYNRYILELAAGRIESLQNRCDKLERKRSLNAAQVKVLAKKNKGFKRTQSTLCKLIGG